MKPKCKKIKFHVFPDPLPGALTANEAQTLAERAIGGDKIARERLIVGSLRIVTDIVGTLLYSEQDRLQGLSGEDLYSAGCEELCEAVDKLRHAECPTAYLRVCVEGRLRDEITKHEEGAMPPLSDYVPDWKESAFPEREGAPPLNEHEVDFIIDEFGETEQFKQYLRLRRDGETIKDAAAAIGRPASSMGDWERRWAKDILEFLAASRRFQGVVFRLIGERGRETPKGNTETESWTPSCKTISNGTATSTAESKSANSFEGSTSRSARTMPAAILDGSSSGNFSPSTPSAWTATTCIG